MEDSPNRFAESIVRATVTPGKMWTLVGILISFAFIMGGMQTRIVMNQSTFQANQVIIQGQISDILSTVSMMSQDHVRLDSEVKKNREISDLRHLQ